MWFADGPGGSQRAAGSPVVSTLLRLWLCGTVAAHADLIAEVHQDLNPRDGNPWFNIICFYSTSLIPDVFLEEPLLLWLRTVMTHVQLFFLPESGGFMRWAHLYLGNYVA